MERLQYDTDYSTKRWLGYVDLLGMKTLITSKSHIRIFSIYQKAIKEVKKRGKTLRAVQSAWFSDTFVIYTTDRSISDFGELDHIFRWFFYFLIEGEIPARGAISCGDFYADKENNLYFGKALIEAYEYGEAQDWIGFLLCPSAEKELKSIGFLEGGSLTYAYGNIPYNKRSDYLVAELPACVLGCWITINDKNPSLARLEGMRARFIDEERVRRKYDNAIEFIRKNKRIVVA